LGLPLVSDHNALGQEKDPIKALFDGVPADLQVIRANPVRCDRVNDWLAENVNGKGKTIEMRVEVYPANVIRSKDGTYQIGLRLKDPAITILGGEWSVHLTNGFNVVDGTLYQLGFRGVKTADAEKVADARHILIQGKVKEVKVARVRNVSKPAITVLLEEVQVDGSKWTPNPEQGGFEADGPLNPFRGAPKGKNKKGAQDGK